MSNRRKRYLLPYKYNTLDIDTNDVNKIQHIVLKISQCKNILRMKTEPSFQKGFHIKLFCKNNCEICRLVFDDTTRYFYDQFRKEESQNVLFDEKEFIPRVKKT